jgi:hypothetical protein
MKRIITIFAIMIIAICTMAIVSSAEENVPEVTHTYYLVQDKYESDGTTLTAKAQELVDGGISADSIVAIKELITSTNSGVTTNTIFVNAGENAHVMLILQEDIFSITSENNGILVNIKMTLTIDYNSYAHYVDCGGSARAGIVLRHADAYLRLIGHKGRKDILNDEIVAPKGDISNGDFDATGCNLDVHHNGNVYAWIFGGSVYVDNIRSYTSQEIFYFDNTSNERAEIYNSVCKSGKNVLGFVSHSPSTWIADNCYLNGDLNLQTMKTGSRITNCDFYGSSISCDAWDIKNNVVVFENCRFPYVVSGETGRFHFLIKNCRDINKAQTPSRDNGGGQHVVFINDPTFEEGTFFYAVANGGDKIYLTYATYAEYKAYSENKLEYMGITDADIKEALGHVGESDGDCTTEELCERCGGALPVSDSEHKYVPIKITYTSFAKDGEKSLECKKCQAKKEAIANAIFEVVGYSLKEKDGKIDGITSGYKIDIVALNEYETLYNDLQIGVFVSNKSYFKGNEFIENGVLTNEFGIHLLMSQRDYSKLNCTVVDMSNSTEVPALIFALYVIEGNNIEYIQKEYSESKFAGETTLNNVTLHAVTVSEIQAILSEIPETQKALLNDED